MREQHAEGLIASPDYRWRWLILTLLAVGVMISFIDRTSISAVLATPAFKKHFALSDLDRGWINSAFFWSYAVMQIPFGWLVDRRGVKWPYAICFAVWCVATALTGLVDGFSELIAVRLLVGAAEAIVVPASWRWIRTHFAERQSGTAVGIYMLGTKIGPALGTPIAASLIGITGWRTMFFIIGLAGLIWLLPWILLVSDDRHSPAAANPKTAAPPSFTIRQLLISPLIWATMIVVFCYNYFTFYCMTWMPAYLVEQRGLSLEKMGLYAFFSFAGIGFVALFGGWAADRLIGRGGDPVFVRKAFTVAGFGLAASVVLGAYAPTLGQALFWNVASLSGLGLATSNHLALCRLTLIPESGAGLVSGFQQVATAIAGIVAPILTAWLLKVGGDYTLPIDAIFVFLVIGALSTIFLLRPSWSLRGSEMGA